MEKTNESSIRENVNRVFNTLITEHKVHSAVLREVVKNNDDFIYKLEQAKKRFAECKDLTRLPDLWADEVKSEQ